MPQMSPMWWFTLMMMFIIMMIIINMMIYFNKNYLTIKTSEKKMFNKIMWKW